MTRLVDCGLVRVGRIEPRRGRPIKHYRAIAEVFLVNSADLSEQVSERLSCGNRWPDR
jgi:predicted ArsR family transcriptional regulator